MVIWKQFDFFDEPRHNLTDSLTTVEDHLVNMRASIDWSRTRRDLFMKCPRAWYLRYCYQSKSNASKGYSNSRKPWDLMLRAMKEILIERIEDLREGKQWSLLLVEHQLKHALQKNLENSNQKVNKRYLAALLRYANHRMTLLWRCRIIQQLVRKQHPCWYVLDRTEPVSKDTRLVYCSPDLAILIQNNWHLIRFDMQSAPKNPIDELEANAMVYWAKQQDGFPQRELSYRLHTIGWRRGFWNTETYLDLKYVKFNKAKPVKKLYSVAAAFKPNMILETFGFDEETEIVFFDYSKQSLAFKKLLISQWDGEDYPAFLQYAIAKYQMNVTGGNETQGLTNNQLWEREIKWWGGADNIKANWLKYKKLKHKFIHVDICDDPNKITQNVTNEENSIIWWSNAFHTVNAHYVRGLQGVTNCYNKWLTLLEQQNENLYILGKDYLDRPVEGGTIKEYINEYRQTKII